MITDGGPGFGRAKSTQVPATWESPGDVSPGIAFWVFDQGSAGVVEYRVMSGDTEVHHFIPGNPDYNGYGTSSGRFYHNGGTISFQIISGSTVNGESYALGWGSMVDDTDPSHYSITPPRDPDPFWQGGQTADSVSNGDYLSPAAGQYGSPGLNKGGSSDAAVLVPGGGGALAQDGTYWGSWFMIDSQDPANGVGSSIPRASGAVGTYNTATGHLFIVREPIPYLESGYAPGNPWGRYEFPDEKIALVEGYYLTPGSPYPDSFSVLNPDLGTADEVGAEITLSNDITYTDDGAGGTLVWYSRRQGVTKGTGTVVEYMGVPLRQGALRLMTDHGWVTVGRAKYSTKTEGWNPPNNFTGSNWDDYGISQGVLQLLMSYTPGDPTATDKLVPGTRVWIDPADPGSFAPFSAMGGAQVSVVYYYDDPELRAEWEHGGTTYAYAKPNGGFGSGVYALKLEGGGPGTTVQMEFSYATGPAEYLFDINTVGRFYTDTFQLWFNSRSDQGDGSTMATQPEVDWGVRINQDDPGGPITFSFTQGFDGATSPFDSYTGDHALYIFSWVKNDIIPASSLQAAKTSWAVEEPKGVYGTRPLYVMTEGGWEPVADMRPLPPA